MKVLKEILFFVGGWALFFVLMWLLLLVGCGTAPTEPERCPTYVVYLEGKEVACV